MSTIQEEQLARVGQDVTMLHVRPKASTQVFADHNCWRENLCRRRPTEIAATIDGIIGAHGGSDEGLHLGLGNFWALRSAFRNKSAKSVRSQRAHRLGFRADFPKVSDLNRLHAAQKSIIACWGLQTGNRACTVGQSETPKWRSRLGWILHWRLRPFWSECKR